MAKQIRVKELIKQLQKCNQDAIVILTVGNEDKDIFSSSEFGIHGADNDDYIELFMSEDAAQQL
ncbi:MAG: hypothetical protein ACTSYR_04095 [Candidatus Odinarchaeia archaeon]